MDGENNGKPYEQMDDLGVKPTIFGNIHMFLPIIDIYQTFPSSRLRLGAHHLRMTQSLNCRVNALPMERQAAIVNEVSMELAFAVINQHI